MKWPLLKCPTCNATLDNREVRAGKPFVCPSCSESWQLSNRQGNIGGLAALAITICACYLFGLRGLWLVVASVIMLFPVFVAWMFLFYRTLPPQFEPYGSQPSLLKDPEFVTLFPRENAEGDKQKKTDQTEDESPKDS
jgi:hypothetical protein